MKRTTLAACLLGLLGTAATGTAWAVANVGTWSVLKDTPAQFFTDDDWTAFKTALNEALNEAKDGETRGWSNDATGAGGEITILRTVTGPSMDCRETKLLTKARNRSRTSGQVFCIGDNGVWKLGPAKMKSR